METKNQTSSDQVMENAKQEQMEEFKAQMRIRNFMTGYVDSCALKCVVELRIADIIQKHGKPISLSELATALPFPTVNTDYLERLMNYLVHMGLFIRDKDGTFWLTRCAKYLPTMAPMVLGITNDVKIGTWQCLSRALEGGSSPTVFESCHGINLWDYMVNHPEEGQVFNEVMATDTRLVLPALMQSGGSIFKGISSLVDVGGGNGTAMVEIAKKFPTIKCTVFDLPNVIRNSHKSTGVEWVEGDMFESVPRADAVLLKWILHDWSDEDCIRILQRCKEAIPLGGKVIIIETVMDNDKDPEVTRQRLIMNMHMMLFHGGKERTKEEWQMLIHTAGYSKCQITSIFALQSVIEVYP